MPVIIALLHDILITGGVYSLTGREVTSGTVAAFLTILGYSLYDTVIVFDRVRENVPRLPRATFSQIVNRSMSEVLTRSLITGLSSVFLVTVLFIFGGATLKDFAFAMMVGLASGTYSSIFIASPCSPTGRSASPPTDGAASGSRSRWATCPAFPEENVIARVEGGPEEPAPAERPPVAPPEPLPGTRSVPRRRARLLPAPPAPAAEPPAPVGAPRRWLRWRGPRRRRPGRAGDGERRGAAAGADRPELSEASAAALRRVREQPADASRGGARSTGGTADGRAGLVHDGSGALALHGLRPRPFPRRDRRRLPRSGAGAMVSGAIAQIALGKGIGDTDLATALYAVPGALIGLGVVYRSACAPASKPKQI